MKNLVVSLFLSVSLLACSQSKVNDQEVIAPAAYGDIAEDFIGLVLTQPDEAQKLLHEDFRFRYMNTIPTSLMGELVIEDAYNKSTYFTDFLAVVDALLPDGIVLTPIKTISDGNHVAVIMEGRAEGKNGRYDNKYVFTYEFKEGKILLLDEYNSDILVATRLYDNKLISRKSTSAE
ncbi:MAG: nuclear transport factor 2 family protein [Hellea sp.]|nr:nuclear transport factor 2 family protein [Hellea sp.]